MVQLTMEDLESFRKAYQEADNNDQEVFEYKGTDVLTAYAKFVIQYMESYAEKTDY